MDPSTEPAIPGYSSKAIEDLLGAAAKAFCSWTQEVAITPTTKVGVVLDGAGFIITETNPTDKRTASISYEFNTSGGLLRVAGIETCGSSWHIRAPRDAETLGELKLVLDQIAEKLATLDGGTISRPEAA